MTDRPATPTGDAFADLDVVHAYRHRLDYPEALYARLLILAVGRKRALDLGCGTGKLAAGLAPHFAEVVALDPSQPMLAAARQEHAQRHRNIRWRCATGEDLPTEQPFDLAVAGASIHWMDPAVVFPKLAAALRPEGVIAIVDGDGPAQAEWWPAWQAVTRRWIVRLGGAEADEVYRRRMTAHEPWFDVAGAETFDASVTQPVEHLIAAQHSRATWARSAMGRDADLFDDELRKALNPYAVDGEVDFTLRSRAVWGRPRQAAKRP